MAGRPTRRRALGLALAALGGLTLRLPLDGRAHAQGDVPDPGEDEAGSVEPPATEAASISAADPWGVPPVRLAIPSLGVDAEVAPVNYDRDGLMDVPPDPDMVAWFEYGPGMGVPGNAIFAAHVDWAGRPRVFHRLGALEPGDAVLVMDAEGRGFEYRVQSNQIYDAEGAPVEEIFAQTVDPVITLITCGGRYRAATREYLDRIVVVATGA
ncbi:MAG: class F sortase [Chloroflexota bacterium]|nr:class F sortase [Chloroflexota bacterium]